MQHTTNPFGTVQTQTEPAYKPIPGLKVAYGGNAQPPTDWPEGLLPAQRPQTATGQGKGLWARLTEALLNLVSEEVSTTERPIGIAKLTQKTPQPHQQAPAASVFRSGQTGHDYRFNQFTDNPK